MDGGIDDEVANKFCIGSDKVFVVDEKCCMYMELALMESVKTLFVTHPCMVEKTVVKNCTDQTTNIVVVGHMKNT